MEREFSALASLKRNIKFWFERCGCNKEQVIRNIDGWFDFAYAPCEQKAAKEKMIEKLRNE